MAAAVMVDGGTVAAIHAANKTAAIISATITAATNKHAVASCFTKTGDGFIVRL